MNPSDLGFYMPAEWSKHMGTFMEWPVEEAGWPGPFSEIIEAFADTARKISQFEPVIMLVQPGHTESAGKICGPDIKILEMDHDDSWMRDNGPTFIINRKGEIAGIDWKFNAWGGKYPFEKDELVAKRLLDTIEVPILNAPFIMEGGSIHTDGEGTVLTTEECLLNPNRNSQMSKEDLERKLKKYLGAEKVIWLKKGLFGDDTDGHIDNVACFAKPGTIIIQTTKDRSDPNFERSDENLKILKNSVDACGRTFKIIEIEQPAQDQYEGMILPLSYINFYFVNGGIIMPEFGGKHKDTDKKAMEVISKTFPDRKIVPVDGMVLIRGGGNVHCLTQQMPYGVPAKL